MKHVSSLEVPTPRATQCSLSMRPYRTHRLWQPKSRPAATHRHQRQQEKREKNAVRTNWCRFSAICFPGAVFIRSRM
jgi:hypothetical protein